MILSLSCSGLFCLITWTEVHGPLESTHVFNRKIKASPPSDVESVPLDKQYSISGVNSPSATNTHLSNSKTGPIFFVFKTNQKKSSLVKQNGRYASLINKLRKQRWPKAKLRDNQDSLTCFTPDVSTATLQTFKIKKDNLLILLRNHFYDLSNHLIYPNRPIFL